MSQIELNYDLRLNDEFLIESIYNNTKPNEPEIQESLDLLLDCKRRYAILKESRLSCTSIKEIRGKS